LKEELPLNTSLNKAFLELKKEPVIMAQQSRRLNYNF